MSRTALQRRTVLLAAGALAVGGGFGAALLSRSQAGALPPVSLRTGAMGRDAAIRWALARHRMAGGPVVVAFDDTFAAPQAAGSRPVDRSALQLLWAIRRAGPGDVPPAELALPLGYLLHRAAEIEIRRRTPEPAALATSAESVSDLQDAAVVHALLPRPLPSEAAVHALLRRAQLRSELGLHTFSPLGDPVAWSRAMADWIDGQAARLRRIAGLAVSPPALWAAAIEAPDYLPRAQALLMLRAPTSPDAATLTEGSVIGATTVQAGHVLAAVEAFLAGRGDIAALERAVSADPLRDAT